MNPIIFCLFIFSGFCGLLYQVVWIRLAFSAFGVITPVLSVVVSIFMLGLSLGSWGGGKFSEKMNAGYRLPAIMFYAMAEFLIGTGAIFIPRIFKIGEQYLFAAQHMDSATYLFFSAIVIGLALLPICFLMGTTFPLMMAHIKIASADHRKSFSYLYTANVIGAMSGALITAVFLIEILGFTKTIYVGVALNYLIALICIVYFRHQPAGKNDVRSPIPELSQASASIQKKTRADDKGFMALVLFATGFISLSMEVIWVRAFTPILKTTTYSFASLLTVYLMATWMGSYFYRFHLKKGDSFSNDTLLCALSFFCFLPITLNDPGLDIGPVSVLISIFPLCATLGYLTPKLIDDYSSGMPDRAGKAYAVNIIGCILGPLFASYVFLPFLGVKNALIILSALIMLISLLHYRERIFTAQLSGVFFIFAFFLLWRAGMVNNTFEERFARLKDAEIRRDYTATIVSTGKGMKKQLLVNGISITHLTPITKFMAHLPLVFCKEPPQSALVICFGMGTTYRSLLSWGIQATAIELVPSVKAAFGYYFHDAPAILKNPKGKIIIDDGRRFLDRTSNTYDVITIDPPPPVEAAGSSLLYSKEFYASVKKHLKTGGIMQQWFPGGEGKILEAAARSLFESFRYVRVFKSIEGWGCHFLASDSPIADPDMSMLQTKMPASAQQDLMEWYRDKDPVYCIQSILKNELPATQILNPDKSIMIEDDKPFNEYYLLRRFIDGLHGTYVDVR